MDEKTKGAWIVHHTSKLQRMTTQIEHEHIYTAGKAGILLSAISTENNFYIDNTRLQALAKAANINPLIELPAIVEILESQKLIEKEGNGLSILGVTNHAILEHTSNLYKSLSPTENENACLYLSEKASIEPIKENELSEEISDLFRLSSTEARQVINDSEFIGYIDSEILDKHHKYYFNGNLFRRDSIIKVTAVLNSLTQEDQSHLLEINELLKEFGCIDIDRVKLIMGELLFNKVTAIGLYDISVVSNSEEEVGYLTTPTAFSKYGSNSIVDDAFDLAKSFLSSITYGMTRSNHSRGQITYVRALVQALIDGKKIGPVAAIGEDYKHLEMQGVVKIEIGEKNRRTGPMMTLLKKEVGELALQVINHGDISEHSLIHFPTAAATKFIAPEPNRERERRKQKEISPLGTRDILASLRTRGF